jgi:transcriptional regulator with XRE-family HTH domain
MGKHEEIIKLFKSVPAVEEFINSSKFQLGKQILKYRIENGLTHEAIVKICDKSGVVIDKNTLSKIEGGSINIDVKIYKKVIYVLGIKL